jgi:hypothetical protein
VNFAYSEIKINPVKRYCTTEALGHALQRKQLLGKVGGVGRAGGRRWDVFQSGSLLHRPRLAPSSPSR